jgi:general stress protein YciG
MTHADAGRRGGVACVANHGVDYMRAIGIKGGQKGGRPSWAEALAKLKELDAQRRNG